MTSSVGVRDIIKGLQALGLTRESAVIAHVSLSAFGAVQGGPAAVVSALLSTCGTLVMPTFTYQSMVWPLAGPADNAVDYGAPDLAETTRHARFFHPDLPAHRKMSVVAETLRRMPVAVRSDHPVLSFAAAGTHAPEALAGQTLDHPLAPIEWLHHHGGDVLLLGVGHRSNTSLHLAERLAGRKQFLRWAIARRPDTLAVRALRLPNFPGCSDGFDAIEPEVAHAARQVTIGAAVARRVPLAMLIPIAVGWISDEPDALLCAQPDCERCTAVRRDGRPAL